MSNVLRDRLLRNAFFAMATTFFFIELIVTGLISISAPVVALESNTTSLLVSAEP